MTIPIVTSPQADEDIRRIDRWWREHRPASPDLFLDEIVVVHDSRIGEAVSTEMAQSRKRRRESAAVG